MSNPAYARIRSGIPAIAWPPISDGRAAKLAAMLGQLEDSQWLAQGEIAAQQRRQLAVLAAYCAKHSPQFRRRLAEAGLAAEDLAAPGGLQRLPVLRRREVQKGGDLFCAEVPADHAPLNEARTSGSTGEPVTVRRTAVGNFDWSVFTLRENIWYGRDVGKPFCAIRGQVKEPMRAADWGAPTSLLFETGPSLGLPVTLEAGRQAEMIAQFGPASLLAYPSTLMALKAVCEARGIIFDSLRDIRTIGETLTPQMRAELEAFFRARITDNYTSQEIGYIACQCPDAAGYHVMESVMVEILDDQGMPCAEGESGRVTVTDLHNFATPLIRYDIGDYAQAGPPCRCGRGLPVLARILGRERNLAVRPDGTRHWPLMGADYFRVRDVAPVRQYQLIQYEPDRMELRLVSDASLTATQEDQVRAMIGEIFGEPMRVEFTYFDGELPKGPNGKFEIFICRC